MSTPREQHQPLDLAAIIARAAGRTEEQTRRRQERIDTELLAVDALALAHQRYAEGDLEGARRWASVAARHRAPGAAALLDTVNVLSATQRDPALATLATLAANTRLQRGTPGPDADERVEQAVELTEMMEVLQRHIRQAQDRLRELREQTERAERELEHDADARARRRLRALARARARLHTRPPVRRSEVASGKRILLQVGAVTGNVAFATAEQRRSAALDDAFQDAAAAAASRSDSWWHAAHPLMLLPARNGLPGAAGMHERDDATLLLPAHLQADQPTDPEERAMGQGGGRAGGWVPSPDDARLHRHRDEDLPAANAKTLALLHARGFFTDREEATSALADERVRRAVAELGWSENTLQQELSRYRDKMRDQHEEITGD